MVDSISGFPFTPGSVRAIDPAKEAERLAEARKAAADTVTVPRADLEVLLSVAGLYLATFAECPEEAFNGLVPYEEVKEIAGRHDRRR